MKLTKQRTLVATAVVIIIALAATVIFQSFDLRAAALSVLPA